MQRKIARFIIGLALALPLAVNASTWTFSGALNSNQETHPLVLPNPYFGGGLLTASLNDVTGAFSIQVVSAGLTGPAVAAHVHQAPPLVAGPIIVDLGSPSLFAPGLDLYNVNATLTAPQILAATTLNGNPLGIGAASGLYANIHTAANPVGEIRGQLFVTSITAVPVPAAMWLMGSAIGLLVRRRRAV